MKKTIKPTLFGIWMGAMVMSLPQAALATTVGFSIEDPAGSYHADMAKKFANLTAEYSDGDVEVVVYPGGQQGNNRESVEGMLIGTVDMTKAIEAFSPIVRDMEVFGLPYLFQTREQFVRALELPEVKDVVQRLEDEGIVTLAWWENGFRHMTNNAHPIVEPEDVAGLKMRTPTSVTRMDMFRELDANPAPLAFTEVFTALQTGAFDGQENPLQVIYSNKLFEVQQYLSTTRHVYNPQIVAISKIRWDMLTEDQQQALRRAANEIGVEYRSEGEALDNQLLDELSTKMEVNEVNFAAFQNMLAPLYDEFPNQPLIQAILQDSRIQ